MPARRRVAYRPRRKISGRGAYTYGKRAGSASRFAIRGRGAYQPPDNQRAKYDYKTLARPISTAAGATLGGIVGSAFPVVGTAAGAALGGMLGNGIGNIMGWGSYSVKNNSLLAEGVDNAYMHTRGSQVKVRHREYLFDVISSGSANTFNVNSVTIQPGLFASFPWLAQIAQNYQEYSVDGMIFVYKPLTGTAISSSTNTTMGGIAMCTQYNVLTAAPTNKVEMLNEEYAQEVPTFEAGYHIIECGKGAHYGTPLSNLYIRGGAVPTGGTATSFDFGQFSIASYGVQGTSVVLGEVHVVYEISLYKPIANSQIGSDILTDHFQSTTITSAAPLTGMVAVANSSIGGTISSGTTYSWPINFQEGVYQMTYIVHSGSTVAEITSPGATPTNCTILTNIRGDTKQGASIPANTTGAQADFVMILFIQLTGQSASIAFGTGGTIPNSSPTADLFVTQYDANVTL